MPPSGSGEQGWVKEGGRSTEVDLNGQEFLLFRGLRSEDDVDEFAGTYGLLGLPRSAAEQAKEKSHVRPAWARALASPPNQYRRQGAEPLEDWIRQAGLMELALGLWGLRVNPAARRALLSAREKLRARDESLRLLNQQEAASASSSWPVSSVLDGAARAGLVCGFEERWSKETGSFMRVALRPVNWRKIEKAGRIIRPPLYFDISSEGISEFLLGKLVNPWVGRVRPSLMLHSDRIVPGSGLPVDLLGLLWLQLANALLSSPMKSGLKPRLCAWRRCPGPPDRPGVFLWRWGRTDTGTKHRDAIYCHPACQHAAAVDRSRKSEGIKLRRERRSITAPSHDGSSDR